MAAPVSHTLKASLHALDLFTAYSARELRDTPVPQSLNNIADDPWTHDSLPHPKGISDAAVKTPVRLPVHATVYSEDINIHVHCTLGRIEHACTKRRLQLYQPTGVRDAPKRNGEGILG